MTVKQAMELLTKVTATFQGTRQDHAMIAQALDVINQLIKNTQESEEAEKSPE